MASKDIQDMILGLAFSLAVAMIAVSEGREAIHYS